MPLPVAVGRTVGKLLLLTVKWARVGLGWAQHPCNAGVRSVLGRDRGDSSHYLGLLGKSWVSAGSVLRVQVQKERCGEKLFCMATQPVPAAASLSAALAVTLCARGMRSPAHSWICTSVGDSFCM